MSKASELKAKIKGWRKDDTGLSYEEALQALDLLLADQGYNRQAPNLLLAPGNEA